jgi:hypothetical protein
MKTKKDQNQEDFPKSRQLSQIGNRVPNRETKRKNEGNPPSKLTRKKSLHYNRNTGNEFRELAYILFAFDDAWGVNICVKAIFGHRLSIKNIGNLWTIFFMQEAGYRYFTVTDLCNFKPYSRRVIQAAVRYLFDCGHIEHVPASRVDYSLYTTGRRGGCYSLTKATERKIRSVNELLLKRARDRYDFLYTGFEIEDI